MSAKPTLIAAIMRAEKKQDVRDVRARTDPTAQFVPTNPNVLIQNVRHADVREEMVGVWVTCDSLMFVRRSVAMKRAIFWHPVGEVDAPSQLTYGLPK